MWCRRLLYDYAEPQRGQVLDALFKPVVYALVFGALRVQGLDLELAVAAPQAGLGADMQVSKSSASETPLPPDFCFPQ